MNIDAIKRLTGRIPLDECDTKTRACIEFSVRGTPKDRIGMQEELMRLASELEWISLSNWIICIAVCAALSVLIWTPH